MVSGGWLIRLVAEKLADRRCNHIASFIASDVAMYSAFVFDRAMHS